MFVCLDCTKVYNISHPCVCSVDGWCLLFLLRRERELTPEAHMYCLVLNIIYVKFFKLFTERIEFVFRVIYEKKNEKTKINENFIF